MKTAQYCSVNNLGARFSVRSVLTVASFLALSMSASEAANLLVDGNFSLAASGAQTSNSPWVLTVNFPDGSDDSAQFQTGFANSENTGVGGSEAPGTGAGVWFKPFEGNQTGGGDPLAQATLTQSIITTIGGIYELTFRAGRETHFQASRFEVELSSSLLGTSDVVDLLTATIPNGNLGGAASTNPEGTEFTLSLSGVAPGDTLTVTARMVDGEDALVNPQSAFLDRFNLEVVPEPSQGILIALAALTLGVRRRR
ncbi:MAG: PEP-CTERM sorting domain-containing protein [Verrucomicrobiota bacterium]